MTTFNRPARPVLGTLLALILALTPLLPVQALADEPISVGETHAEQTTGAEQPPTDAAEGVGEEGEQAAAAPEGDESGATPATAASEYEAAYQVIETTPCIVDAKVVNYSQRGTVAWVQDEWLQSIAGNLQGAGVNVKDLQLAVTPDGWKDPEKGTDDNPPGTQGKLDFIIKGNESLPNFSASKSATVIPDPYQQPVTSERDFIVWGGTEGTDYTYPEKISDSEGVRTLTVLTSQPLTISMKSTGATTTTDCILVKYGVQANITLQGVKIDLTERFAAPVAVAQGASPRISFVGDCSFTGGYYRAGIEVPNGAEARFVMDSSQGAVNAQGGSGAAGIGGAFGLTCGAMSFLRSSYDSTDQVTLVARGGEQSLYFPYSKETEAFGGAGIGGGACIDRSGAPQPKSGQDAGFISISYGIISAYGGFRGAGIGGGAYHAPNMEITGGTFPKIAGGVFGAGLGGGAAASGGAITIGGTAFFKSIQGGNHSAGIGSSTFADTNVTAGVRDGGKITIGGHAQITTEGGYAGAGLGGGLGAGAGDITIEGYPYVYAYGGEAAAAIGSGPSVEGGSGAGARNSIRISDNAQVYAEGNRYSAGIGGSSGNPGGNISFEGSVSITAKGGERGAGIGGSFGNPGGTISSRGDVTVIATGGERGAAIGGGGSGILNGKYCFGNGGTISLDGGTYKLTPGTNATCLGGGEYGQANIIEISNATIQSAPLSGWHANMVALIGSAAPVGQNADVGEQRISIQGSAIDFDKSSAAHNATYALFGGLSFKGTIQVESGTFEANTSTIEKNPAYLFGTQRANGVIVNGGTFNIAGDGAFANTQMVNGDGQKVYPNTFTLEGANQVTLLSDGMLQGGSYNFTGGRTDETGTTTMLLPANSSQNRPQTRAVLMNAAPEPSAAAFAAAPEVAPALLATEAATTAPVSETAAAEPTPATTPEPTVVSVIAEDGTRYQNSYVRADGETYQKTLYKNGAKVTFDLAGGTGDAPEQNVLPGDTIVEPTGVSRAEHTLTGWTLEGQPYDFTRKMTEFEAGETFTLTAVWETSPATDPDTDPDTEPDTEPGSDPTTDPDTEPGSDTTTPLPKPSTDDATDDASDTQEGDDSAATLVHTGDSALPFALAALAGLASSVVLVARRNACRS